MNLHNLSEQEFDKKLREHLAKSSVPYNPASWNKLSKRLDSLFGTNGNNGSIIGLSLLLLMLTGVFFFGVTSFSQSGLYSDAQVTTSIEASNISSEAETGTSRETINNASSVVSGHDLSDESENGKPEVNRHTSSVTKEVISSKEHLSTEVSKKFSPAKEDPVLLERNGQNSTKADESASLLVNQQLSSTKGHSFGTEEHSSVTNKPVGTNDQVDVGVQSQDELEQLPIPETVSASGIAEADSQKELPDVIHDIDSLNTVPSPVTDKTMASSWFIGFGYAPDISLVGFGEATSPGTNLGLSLEYKLNSRWSVQTGLIYSMKRYKAKGEDYHPPEGFWGYGDAPDGADGECNVIDIPINLRYYFKPSSRHQFFASTGVSSYLMLTEDYNYHYDDYGYHQVDKWSVSNENRHFFSIYNISAGYQRSLSKQWYLEVEPFLKVPLSGIGFGEVDLWSTGAMFSIKYNLK